MFFAKKAHKSLLARVMLLFIVSILIILFVYFGQIAFVTYDFSTVQIENEIKALCTSIVRNIDVTIDKMNHTAIVLVNNPDVRNAMNILQKTDIESSAKLDAERVLNLQSIISTTTKDHYSISFFDEEGSYLYGTLEVENLFDLSDNKTSLSFMERSFIFLYPKEQKDNFRGEEKPYILIRPVYEINYPKPRGYIAAACDASIIENILFEAAAVFKDSVSSFSLYEPESDSLIASTNQKLYLNSNINDTTNSKSLTEVDWNVVAMVPYSHYYNQYISSLLLSLILPLSIAILLYIIISKLLLQSLSPLKNLVSSMNSVVLGDYSHKIEMQTHTEDTELIVNGYNQMLSYIDTLINKEYATRLEMHKYQLQVLHSQINPHFLYNTLQTMESLGELHDVPEIQKIVSLLGKLLHYNLRENQCVSLTTELESARIYMDLQCIRFGSKLKYSINVDKEVTMLSVEKFILQPLVENSILHGFQNMYIPGNITINSYLQNNFLIIDVKDDGQGITKENLIEIHQRIKQTTNGDSEENANKHIGIINVHRRIQTVYGIDYGLEIFSEEKQGTIIRIKIPAEKIIEDKI